MSLKYLLLAFFVHAIFFRMSPGAIEHFLDSPYNKVADIKMLYFFTHISPLSLYVIIALFVLSFIIPYFWCRYLCPYGALLGLFSFISPLKIRRSIPDCTSCGKCAAVCPAFLPVDQKKSISSPECTGCLECVVSCPKKMALGFKVPGFWQKSVRPVVFAVLVAGLFYGGIGIAKIAGRWKSNVSQEELMMRVQKGLDGPEYGHFGR
jgi:polyferredoxin